MSAIWPISVATDADLFTAVNSLSTVLALSVDSVTPTVTLASTSNFPTAGAVKIDNEIIFYTGITGANLTGCLRGSDGTTPAFHNAGQVVGATIIAFHHNGLMAEIEAIEASLNLTPLFAVMSNASGRLAASPTTSTELGYLSGVTSALQTQLGAKANTTLSNLTDIVAINKKLNNFSAGTVTVDNLSDLGNLDLTPSSPSAPAPGIARIFGATAHGFTFPAVTNETGQSAILGRDNYYLVKNDSGSTIAAGSYVYSTGSASGVPRIALAKADLLATLPAIGIVVNAILNGAFGIILYAGQIGANNTGFSTGNTLWISATTAGAATNVRPSSPNYMQAVATVVLPGPSGSIFAVFDRTVQGQDSGANTALSNLTSTSINQGLEPSTDNTFDFGDSTHRWRNLFLGNSLNFPGGGTVSSSNSTDLTLSASNYTAVTLAGMTHPAIIPSQDGTINLGSASFRFDDLHLAGDSTASREHLTSAGSISNPTLTIESTGNGSGIYAPSTGVFGIVTDINTTPASSASFDSSSTAGNTRMFLWDVDSGALQRVTVGVVDSGGVGFKVLRIPN